MSYRDFLNLTHAYAWHQAHLVNSTPDEPGLVSALIATPMIQELERLVRAQLNVKHVILNGIFTHKTPTVKPRGAANSVEIGDMLFVRQHLSGSTATIGRAFLIQAKRNTTPTSGGVAQGNPRIQFDLYKKWPRFEGTSRIPRGCAGGNDWAFQANSNEPFGRYTAIYGDHAFTPATPPTTWVGAPTPAPGSGFTHSGYKNDTTWGYGNVSQTTNPRMGVACPDDFADLLSDFVLGNAGAPFVPGQISAQDHWSSFINEMLLVAASGNYTFFSRRTGVLTPTPRKGTVTTFQAAVSLALLMRKESVVDLVWEFMSGPGRISSAFPETIRQAIKDIDQLAGESMYLPPPPPGGVSQPPDEPGHPPILSLITVDDACPEGLRAESPSTRAG